jgi:hypothetical protein
MKFLRILTVLISVTACTATVKGGVHDNVVNEYADDSEFGENEMEESQRHLNADNIRSYLNHHMPGKKGSMGGAGDMSGKGGKGGKGYKGGKGGMGGKGASGSAPAYSPVLSPTSGCGTPVCGETDAPVSKPVSTPTCSSTDGCASPVAAPACTGTDGCGSPVATPTCDDSAGCGEPVASPVYETGGNGGGKGGGKIGGKKGGTGGGKGYGKKGGKKGYDKSGKGGMAPAPAPTGDGTCGCEVDSVKLDFTMLPYNVSVPISPNAAESEIGTVFIFNDPLFDLNLTVLDGTFVGGLCTKTQATQNAGASTTIVGGGYCFFTYTVSNGNTSVTFNAAGEVFDVLGGTLSIEGGTGELSGSYGEVELTPVYQQESQTDFFLEASLYVGGASLFVPLF